MDNIIKLVSEEIEKRVNERLSVYTDNMIQIRNAEYASIISKKHGIPMNILLRDIPYSKDGSCICKGVKKKGKLCTTIVEKGVGYCGFHIDQKEKNKPLSITQPVCSTQLHENTMSRNQLIELQSILK